MSWKKPGETPEPNRMIVLKCCDWSDYTCEGMWIPYKQPGGPKKLKGKSRFCRLQNGAWSSDRDTWKDCEEWRYADESE